MGRLLFKALPLTRKLSQVDAEDQNNTHETIANKENSWLFLIFFLGFQRRENVETIQL